MRTVASTILLLLLVFVGGCGRNGADRPTSEPLTMENWKNLSAESKYEIGTLERLKLGEPKLQDDREWERFTRNVLLPGKKKELATAK